VQELSRRLWSAPAPTAEGRLAAFFLNHVERAEGKKVFYVQKADLASFTNESFSKITSTLASLQNQGLLTYFRGVLTIPDAAKLLELINPTENQQGI
jgi:CRP-like cAMP-binding protein